MHLASFNVARMRAPIEDPVMAGFVDGLDAMNALAEASPGFVWRMVDDSRDEAAARPFPDPLDIVTLAVWSSIDSLRAFTYKTEHVEFLKRRREWFVPYPGPFHVLWWLDEGGPMPTNQEGVRRLAALAADGPTPDAFGFRQAFEAASS